MIMIMIMIMIIIIIIIIIIIVIIILNWIIITSQTVFYFSQVPWFLLSINNFLTLSIVKSENICKGLMLC